MRSHDAVLGDALDEFIGARADEMVRQFVALLGDRLRRDHHPGAVGQYAEERRIGLREDEPDGKRIDDLDRRHLLQLGLALGFGRGLVALDIGLDGGGVELGAVVKENARPQLHRQRQFVRRPRPLGGEKRCVGKVAVDVDQLVAQPGEDHPADEADALGGIERVGILLQRDAQRAGRGRGADEG